MAPIAEVVGGSFRDPAGFVFRRDGVLYRQVNKSSATNYDALMGSGLAERLTTAGLLIPHVEADNEPAAPGAHRILRPEEVGFVSYPYEWSFSQLRDAALATLEVQSLALEHGMSLRDASAYNVQFHRGRPVLIDTLSFEPRREGPWVAYRQFCAHFLAPLALMSFRDARLGLLAREHVDGVPLDLAVGLLPRRARIRPVIALHLVGHARAQSRVGRAGSAGGSRGRFGEAAHRGLIENLRSGIGRLPRPTGDSVWRDYYEQATHYTDEAADAKAAIVDAFLDRVRPSSVWDLGANTGRFSRLASSRSVPTVAFDLDHDAVDSAYRLAREQDDRALLPLVLDLTNPSPAIGWSNQERMTLMERGPTDLVLALALVHHLAIGNNVPLPMIAGFLASLGRYVAIEWVPKDDLRVQQLLSTREDIFDRYAPAEFERALEGPFEIQAKEPVAGSTRILYLAERT